MQPPKCVLEYLCPEVALHVLSRLSEREKGRRGILAHRLLELMNLLRDSTKSGLRSHEVM